MVIHKGNYTRTYFWMKLKYDEARIYDQLWRQRRERLDEDLLTVGLKRCTVNKAKRNADVF